jgi:hypothetical protein
MMSGAGVDSHANSGRRERRTAGLGRRCAHGGTTLPGAPGDGPAPGRTCGTRTRRRNHVRRRTGGLLGSGRARRRAGQGAAAWSEWTRGDRTAGADTRHHGELGKSPRRRARQAARTAVPHMQQPRSRGARLPAVAPGTRRSWSRRARARADSDKRPPHGQGGHAATAVARSKTPCRRPWHAATTVARTRLPAVAPAHAAVVVPPGKSPRRRRLIRTPRGGHAATAVARSESPRHRPRPVWPVFSGRLSPPRSVRQAP